MEKIRLNCYEAYASAADITFIMAEVYEGDTLREVSCKGWYYGQPNPSDTQYYYGNLIATY